LINWVLAKRAEISDRSVTQLAGTTNQIECLLLILDARKLDHDRVTLTTDVWLGDAETVDATTNNVDRLVQRFGARVSLGLQHDAHTALKVKAKYWLGIADERERCGAVARNHDAEQWE
jgi:hypothetical protein